MDKIKSFLEEAVKDGVFPGCCVAIVRPQKTQYLCVGKKATTPKEEANEINTLYDLASLTKVVGTLPVILTLIQRDQLSYETKVSSIVPAFKNDEITIMDLLTHRSGLPSDLGWDKQTNKEDMIADICEFAKTAKPQQEVIYSDLGFMMLGYIAETITQQPLDVLVTEYVLKPLHMENTRFNPISSLKQKCAPTEDSLRFHKIMRGEVHDRKAHFMNGVSGHAGLFSNVFDLEKYARMLLNNGMVDGHRYLIPTLIKDLYTCQTSHLNVMRGVGYLTCAPDSIFAPLNSPKTIGHTGFTGTSFIVDFDKEIAIIVLSNRIHPSRNNTKILKWRAQFHQVVMTELTELK